MRARHVYVLLVLNWVSLLLFVYEISFFFFFEKLKLLHTIYKKAFFIYSRQGTFIENKGSALVWQYRDSDPEFGAWQ